MHTSTPLYVSSAMFEIVAEVLFKPLIGLIRFIGLIAFEGVIFRPLYWLGWCVLKLVTLGKLPKGEINNPDHETRNIEFLTWSLGVLMVLIFGVTTFA